MTEETLLKVLQLILPLGTSGVAVIAVVLYLFSHPEKFDQWGNLFYKLLDSLARRWTWLAAKIEHGVVAWDIQDSINTAGESLSKQSPDILPHALRIEWVKTADPETFLKGGEVIVRLNHHSNQDIVTATLAYLGKGLLPRARQYFDDSLRQATDFTVARYMLAKTRGTGAPDYFITNVLLPAFDRVPQLRNDSAMLEDLESIGVLTRIFLHEVRELGERVFPAIPNERTASEIRQFASFLQVIACKWAGEDVPLSYSGTKLKVGIVLVAKSWKLQYVGIAPYLKSVEHKIKDGFESIYICGWGQEFVASVRDILSQIEDRGWVRILRRYEFPIPRHTGTSNKGILAVCQSSSTFLAEEKRRKEPIRAALLRQVPEVYSGEVEIVNIAREPAVGSKVAVRMTSELGTPQQAVQICRGKNGDRYDAIKAELPNGEWIDIVEWQSDIKDFIIAALHRVYKTSILRVDLDEERMVAQVFVKDSKSASKAVGPDGCNVKLAEQLVGWQINIEVMPQQPPTDLLLEILRQHVPEIVSNEVEIVAAVRKPGTGSKVAVRMTSEIGTSQQAVQICLGKNGDRNDVIKAELPKGEWVGIIAWQAEIEDFISEALYPIPRADILNIDLDEARKIAQVFVKDSLSASKAVGLDGCNVWLAEQLVGWQIQIDVASKSSPTDTL